MAVRLSYLHLVPGHPAGQMSDFHVKYSLLPMGRLWLFHSAMEEVAKDLGLSSGGTKCPTLGDIPRPRWILLCAPLQSIQI